MSIHKKYNLTRIINARGVFTPLGVSRSSLNIANIVAKALSDFFLIDELQKLASEKISELTGSESGCITHCTSSSISLSIAGIMTNTSEEKIFLLPDVSTMKSKVVIPKGHVVNYGHSILQDIRITGATPVIVGGETKCCLAELEIALSSSNVACLLLVSSRLVRDENLNLKEAILIAKKYNIPTVIDAAAQDFRANELLSLGADLILLSAQKYLLSPTAGIVYGKKELIDAVYANEKGIGRSMKATKEAIIGVISAIDERLNLDLDKWKKEQDDKLVSFIDNINKIAGLKAISIPDYTGLPFSRACLSVDESISKVTTCELSKLLKSNSPQIWTIDNECKNNRLIFEILPLTVDELKIILERLTFHICKNKMRIDVK